MSNFQFAETVCFNSVFCPVRLDSRISYAVSVVFFSFFFFLISGCFLRHEFQFLSNACVFKEKFLTWEIEVS